MSKTHLKRWLTSIIALPLLIVLIALHYRWPFFCLLYLISLLGLMEFYQITIPSLPISMKLWSYILTFVLFLTIYLRQVLFVPIIFVFWAFGPMTLYLLRHLTIHRQLSANIGLAVLGPVYIGLPLAMLAMIDIMPNGKIWIFFLLAIIFAGDTGAYYCGKHFGKRKLYREVSPGKTWAGAVGGLLASLIVAALFLKMIPFHKIEPGIFILVGILSMAGQIGDLVESMLKRSHGIKDSGFILPGHGGILDRIDSLLFCIPLLYMYRQISMITISF